MPRPPRIRGTGLSYHVIARCNNDEFLLQKEGDFCLYLQCLAEVKNRIGFGLNNYTLMNNHVHLILTSASEDIDKVMYLVHLLFSKAYNRQRARKGHFWRDRYKSLVIADDRYGLACMRYINRNPVRAGIVKSPADWPWTAYRHYAFGEPNTLLTPFPSYLALGNTAQQRQDRYRDLVEANLGQEREEKLIFTGRLRRQSHRYNRISSQVIEPLIKRFPVPFGRAGTITKQSGSEPFRKIYRFGRSSANARHP